jgi:hypothetical protein
LVREPEERRRFLTGIKKASGFSVPGGLFKEYLLQVLPETTLFAHRHTAITAL